VKKKCLREDEAGFIDSAMSDIILDLVCRVFAVVEADVAAGFLYDGPLQGIPLKFKVWKFAHNGINHLVLEFLLSDSIESFLVGHFFAFLGEHLGEVDFAVGEEQLVELLPARQPELFKSMGEVLLELEVDLVPPDVLLISFEGLQKLFDDTVYIFDL
jgi:hypothetical protein